MNAAKQRIWLEIFIIPGINDTESELVALKSAIVNISPDRVQLNTLDRPGPVSSIRSATPEELQRIIRFWQLDNISIIAKVQVRKKIVSYRKTWKALFSKPLPGAPARWKT